MSNALYRLSTANQYDIAVRNISQRQSALSNLQENLTSGKRVVRPSDDPVAAAQAERALTRIERLQTEQRALDARRNTIAQAESSLGEAVNLVQEMRQLIVDAGSGTKTANDRRTIANQIHSLREQLSAVANRKDTNGAPLFGALGSALAPFIGPQSSPDYAFAGLEGQFSATSTNIPAMLDGNAAFMFQPNRDGVFHAQMSLGPLTELRPDGSIVASTTSTSRLFGSSAVEVVDASLINTDINGNAYDYTLTFSGVGPGATANTLTAAYTITSSDPSFTPVSVTVPDFAVDKPLSIPVTGVPGLKFDITATSTKNANGSISLAPANGNTISVKPSASIFSTVDTAVRELTSAQDSNAAVQAVGQALANLDRGMERLHDIRGFAGEMLNRADRITGNLDTRAVQLENDRSRAEDLDMIKGISDFQNQQVGYEAALKSYAQVQQLSLFKFI